ncbi:MAG: pyridoxine 5'-phosphate oxidase C-terminal domain-containing protein [Ilumatobacteraceae bacterium]
MPRPPHWGGWRILADSVEFWQGQRDRLHDRLRFERAGDTWTVTRLDRDTHRGPRTAPANAPVRARCCPT